MTRGSPARTGLAFYDAVIQMYLQNNQGMKLLQLTLLFLGHYI